MSVSLDELPASRRPLRRQMLPGSPVNRSRGATRPPTVGDITCTSLTSHATRVEETHHRTVSLRKTLASLSLHAKWCLHDNAAIAQFPDHLWQDFANELVHFILLWLLWVWVWFMMVLVTRLRARILRMRPVMLLRGMATRLMVMTVGAAAGEIDVDPTRIFLCMIPQAEIATDLLDAGLEFLDVVDGVIPFPDNASLPSATHKKENDTKECNITYTCKWVSPRCRAARILCSRISSASSTNCPCRSIVSGSTRPGALFSRKMNSEACLLYMSINRACSLPCSESSFAAAPSPLSYARRDYNPQ